MTDSDLALSAAILAKLAEIERSGIRPPKYAAVNTGDLVGVFSLHDLTVIHTHLIERGKAALWLMAT